MMARFFRKFSLILIVAALLLMGGPSALAQSRPADAPPPPPSRLQTPSIDLDTSILAVGWISTKEGTTWDVPQEAAGWLTTSTPPSRMGNAVLIGHHNIEGKVFRNLKDVEVGDRLTVTVGKQTLDYEVSERMLLREIGVGQETRRENARWIGPFPDERSTLVTCWPSWANTHRLILVAHPVVPEVVPAPTRVPSSASQMR